MPVTMSAPGSSTAMGGSRLRIGLVMSPSCAAPNAANAMMNAARNGVRVATERHRPESRMKAAVTCPATAANATLGHVGCRISAMPVATHNMPSSSPALG